MDDFAGELRIAIEQQRARRAIAGMVARGVEPMGMAYESISKQKSILPAWILLPGFK